MKFEVDNCMDDPVNFEVLGEWGWQKHSDGKKERGQRVYAKFYQPDAEKHAKAFAKVLEKMHPDGWAKP